MSVHMKAHRTKRAIKSKAKTLRQERNISWRVAAEGDIEKYSEPGLMLRGSRYKAELTQKQLAEAIGISSHHISEMENGKRAIGKAMAKRFAEFFKSSYRVFL